MSVAAIVPTVLTFAAIVGVGALLRGVGLLGPEDARPLNTVIVYVGLPAFIFSAVHGAPVDRSMFGVVGVAWAVFLGCALAALLVSRLLGLDGPKTGALVLVSALGNTGYLGYPLTAAVMGEAAVSRAVFYDIFGTVFAMVLVGLPIAARLGEHDSEHPHPLKELLTFPAVVALFFALALRSAPVPVAVSSGIDVLAKMVAPLIMLSVGLSLRPRALSKGIGLIVAAVLIRLLVAPLLARTVGSWILVGQPLEVAILEAATPSMMLTLVVGERFGLDTELIAAAIFVTTMLSAGTLMVVATAI